MNDIEQLQNIEESLEFNIAEYFSWCQKMKLDFHVEMEKIIERALDQ